MRKNLNTWLIFFPRSGSFSKAMKHLCEQAKKRNKHSQFILPDKCQLDLFDKVIVAVM